MFLQLIVFPAQILTDSNLKGKISNQLFYFFLCHFIPLLFFLHYLPLGTNFLLCQNFLGFQVDNNWSIIPLVYFLAFFFHSCRYFTFVIFLMRKHIIQESATSNLTFRTSFSVDGAFVILTVLFLVNKTHVGVELSSMIPSSWQRS